MSVHGLVGGSAEPIDPHGLLDDALWRSMLPAGMDVPSTAALAWRLSSGRADDLRRLAAALASLPEGSPVLVLADRRCLRSLLRLRRLRESVRARGAKRLQRALGRAGVDVAAVHLVWPDAANARVVAPKHDAAPWQWAQRAGMLGGGGSRRLLRLLLRSPLFTPLVRAFTAGIAITGRKRAL